MIGSTEYTFLLPENIREIKFTFFSRKKITVSGNAFKPYSIHCSRLRDFIFLLLSPRLSTTIYTLQHILTIETIVRRVGQRRIQEHLMKEHILRDGFSIAMPWGGRQKVKPPRALLMA